MRRIGFAVLLALLAGAAWWVVGFLPWISDGFHWPTTTGAPVGSSSAGLDGVRLPVPLIAIDLPFLLAAGLIGSVLAGLAPIMFTGLTRWFAVVWVWLSVAAVLVTTTLLSAHRIHTRASTEFAADSRVLEGLLVALVAATVLGLVAGSISVLRHGFTSIAAALVAGSFGVWLDAFLVGRRHDQLDVRHLESITHVGVAVVLGLGLVVSVHRTSRSALLWPFAFAIAWCAGPAYTASVYLAAQLRPSSGLPGSLPRMVGGSRHVFWDALSGTHPELWPLGAALVAGLLALLVMSVRRRRLAARAAAAPEVTDEGDVESVRPVGADRGDDPDSHATWLSGPQDEAYQDNAAWHDAPHPTEAPEGQPAEDPPAGHPATQPPAEEPPADEPRPGSTPGR